jgi:hypothetical protein
MIISAYLQVAGLTDVGYRFYNPNETANGSRITAGVVDAGDGWYSADATFPSGISSVRWNSVLQPQIVAREYFGVTVDNNAIAAAVWQVLTSGFTTAGTVGKLVADNLNATVSSRATQTSVDTVDDFLDTEIAAIKLKTDNLPSASPGSAGGLFIAGSNTPTNVNFTGNITGNLIGDVTGSVHDVEDTDSIAIAVRDISNAAPAAGSLGADVKAGITGGGGGASWDEVLPGSHAPGTAGYILGHNLDAQVSTRLATSGYTAPPDAATIGVACRDTNNASPAAGSVGDKINSAAAGGDPWSVAIPAAYPAGSAGKILGDRLDVLVSSRLATTGYTVAPSAAVIADSVRDVNNQTPAANSLGAAVNNAAAAGDPWVANIGTYTTPGTAGKLMNDQLDAKISTRLPTSSYVVPPTAAVIGVACRDTNNSAPASGSVGDKINSAASAGDPWATVLPSATYPPGGGRHHWAKYRRQDFDTLQSASYVEPPTTVAIRGHTMLTIRRLLQFPWRGDQQAVIRP